MSRQRAASVQYRVLPPVVNAVRRGLQHGATCVVVITAVVLAAGALHAMKKPDKRHGFPAPGDKPEGLAWDGAALWCNNFDDGALYKLDPATGSVLAHYQQVPGLPASPEGLAWDGEYLWTCDWHAGLIVKFRERAGEIEIVDTFEKPADSGPNVGLEWDGTSLWLTCWPEAAKNLDFGQLYELDPVTLAVRRRLILPVHFVEDLAWDGRYLWSADWLLGIGFAIERTTGDTLYTYRTPGPNPVGQAWDGESLWVTDTERDSIWALDVSGTTPAARTSWSRIKELFRRR